MQIVYIWTLILTIRLYITFVIKYNFYKEMSNMKICSPCLFYDDEDHIWRFYVNDNKELMYSIMYDEDKWTKENKIDNDVLDFTVNFDKDNKIYIIYSVKGSAS